MKKLLLILILIAMSFSTSSMAKDLPKESNTLGIIKNIYELQGIRYIDMDIVEFYRGEEALKEAIKDGKAKYDQYTRKFYITDGYYIRNDNKEITTYKLAENVQYYLCLSDVNNNLMENSVAKINVSKEQFNEYINKSSEYDYMSCNRAKLFWAKITSDYIKSLSKQYTP